jgi:hypothetical protein
MSRVEMRKVESRLVVVMMMMMMVVVVVVWQKIFVLDVVVLGIVVRSRPEDFVAVAAGCLDGS